MNEIQEHLDQITRSLFVIQMQLVGMCFMLVGMLFFLNRIIKRPLDITIEMPDNFKVSNTKKRDNEKEN